MVSSCSRGEAWPVAKKIEAWEARQWCRSNGYPVTRGNMALAYRKIGHQRRQVSRKKEKAESDKKAIAREIERQEAMGLR